MSVELGGNGGSDAVAAFAIGAIASFRAGAVPEPAGVARDPLYVSNPARFDVPITMISTTFTREEIEQAIKNDVPYFAELPRIRSVGFPWHRVVIPGQPSNKVH